MKTPKKVENWVIGIPMFRINVWFVDRNPDGMAGRVLSYKDLNLVDDLLYDSIYTNALHSYVTLNPLMPENVKTVYILLADVWDINNWWLSRKRIIFQR
mgnify:CR=1 FL=1